MDTAENQLDGTPISKEELLRKHAHFLESIRNAKVSVVRVLYTSLSNDDLVCHVMIMCQAHGINVMLMSWYSWFSTAWGEVCHKSVT